MSPGGFFEETEQAVSGTRGTTHGGSHGSLRITVTVSLLKRQVLRSIVEAPAQAAAEKLPGIPCPVTSRLITSANLRWVHVSGCSTVMYESSIHGFENVTNPPLRELIARALRSQIEPTLRILMFRDEGSHI